MGTFLKRAGKTLEKVGKESLERLAEDVQQTGALKEKAEQVCRKLEIIGKKNLGRLAKDFVAETKVTDQLTGGHGSADVMPSNTNQNGHQSELPSTETEAGTQNENMMDNELRVKLQNVFQQGKVPFYVRTLAVCGYRSAGKTTLLRKLLNESFREDEPITDGIQIGQMDIKNWGKKLDNPSDDLTTAIASCVLNSGKQPLEGAPAGQSGTDSGEEQKGIDEGAVMNEGFANEILMKVKETTRVPEEFSVFRYYDFGGHVEYHQMHMPFLPNNAVYLLVVNLNLELNNTLPAKERPLRGQKVIDACGFTVQEYLDYWIRCISSICRDSKTTHHVILVGTFANDCINAEEALSTIYNYLQKYFPSGVLYDQTFTVDNSVDHDQGTGYSELRSAIEKLSRQVAFEHNIALCHAKLYYHILHCTEKYLLCSDLYLPWYEIMGSPQGIEVSSADKKLHIQAALQVLNCMKFAYYSDPILVLDPQWLIDLMAALIPINCMPPPKVQTAPFPIQREWMKLVNTGKFSENLLQYIWSIETLKLKVELLDIMKSLKLVVHANPESKCYHLWFKRKQREIFLCFYENQVLMPFRKDVFNELIPLFQKEWPCIESLDATFVQLKKAKNADYKVHLELRHDKVLLVNKNEFEHDDFVYKVGSIVEPIQKQYPTLFLFVDGKPYKAIELFLQVRHRIQESMEVVNVVKIILEDQPEKQRDIFFRDQSVDIRFDTTPEDMVDDIEERMLIKALAELNRFHGAHAEEICRQKLELLPKVYFFSKGRELVTNLCELLIKLHNDSMEDWRYVLDDIREIFQCCVIQCMLDTASQPVDYSEIQTLDAYEMFEKAQHGISESAIRDILHLQDISMLDKSTMLEDFAEKLTMSIHRLFWIVKLVFVKCVDGTNEKSAREKSLEESISTLYFKSYRRYMECEKELGALRSKQYELSKARNSTPNSKDCKGWIHKNFSNFVQKMGEGVHRPVVDKLFEKCLNNEEVGNVSSKSTSQEKNRELLSIMLNKGESVCRLFLTIFCNEDPSNEMTRKQSGILLLPIRMFLDGGRQRVVRWCLDSRFLLLSMRIRIEATPTPPGKPWSEMHCQRYQRIPLPENGWTIPAKATKLN
ncbi:uncharacterized protein LOC119968947 isoform X2 [Scyliorhinus canicula]|uniref:uncharacterized protein LOC119968947 isoform X2 n=1 Tax=Scyliorhinus canicula TaxID=7830 RepID=UPI0018F78919|nr:uncharacterized protein LOC119968947 isoform X2 [Scyliorhinus canicula]